MFLRSSVVTHSSKMFQNDPAIMRKLQHKWKNLNMLLVQHTDKSDGEFYFSLHWMEGWNNSKMK